MKQVEDEMELSKLQIQRLSEVPNTKREEVLNEVVRVEKETWPEEIQAPKEKFLKRAQVFPEGFLTISLPDLGMVGVSTSQIINFNPGNPPISWEETTDNGWIKNTHDNKGNALYLVSVGASSRAQGKGIGTRLVREQIELAKKLKLDWLVLGARIPGYHEYHNNSHDTSIEDYLNIKREDGESYDPEIRFYQRCGLEVFKVVPNYMDDDPESENYCAIMVWKNSQVLDKT